MPTEAAPSHLAMHAEEAGPSHLARQQPLPAAPAQEARRPRHPSKYLAITGGALIALAVVLFALATSQQAATRDEGSQGSLATVTDTEVEVVELTAWDLLAASSHAHTLFAEAEARKLAHSGSFDNLIDDDILATTQAFADVATAIGDIEDDGYDVGIVLVDLGTGGTFAYNANKTFYSASSIKGPYVACLYEELVETGKVSLSEISRYAKPIIVSSDNGAYANLHRRYGGDAFELWLEDVGYDSGEYADLDEVSDRWYLHINAWQLASLWERAYEYLTSDTEAVEQLTGYFEARTYSAMNDALGEQYATWGKAGWYPSRDGSAWPATVDAGIVLADHPYVVVVLSNVPDDMPRLCPVFSALDELHEGLYLLGGDYRVETRDNATTPIPHNYTVD